MGSGKLKFESVSLRDVALINPPFKTNGVSLDALASFVPMASISEITGQIVQTEPRKIDDCRRGFTSFMNDDVLIAKITPCFENGKIAIAKIPHDYGFGSTEFHVVRSNPQKLLPNYLFHFLRQPYFRSAGERRMTGSAGQRRVPTDFLSTFEIPLPTLHEQKRIAAILDKADAIRRKRQAAIKLADDFLRATFLDMFGDPVTNPKNIKIVCLSDITTKITDGVHQKPQYTETGTPFISVKDITTGSLKFDNCKFISDEDHKKFTKRCKAERLDILYTKVGATYGRPALVNTDQEFSIYVSVCLIKPNKQIVDPFYLKATLETPAIKRQADKRIKGIGVPDLHLDQIKQLLIPLPNIEQQQEFAKRVAKVEKLKGCYINSLTENDILFNSLTQRAFRGDL